MPKPRTAAQLVHDEEALRVRDHVIESLTEYVKHRASGRSSRRPTQAAAGRRNGPASRPTAERHVPTRERDMMPRAFRSS